MAQTLVRFLRYPGGKQRFLSYIRDFLPPREDIKKRYVEPFVGGGSVFFDLAPTQAILSDINADLIDLYKGIRRSPRKVWKIFHGIPGTKQAYYEIRDADVKGRDLAWQAARVLYLNRTCFKGMWRHNSSGQFNVGYGGQDRRWVISEDSLLAVSSLLKQASLKCADFERVIEDCDEGDYIFLDPPYLPGKRELVNEHYFSSQFTFEDHIRLAKALQRASQRGVRWCLTISSHRDIIKLFTFDQGNTHLFPLPTGTGRLPGEMVRAASEVLIRNYAWDDQS